MADATKVTLNFSSLNGGQWSEDYWAPSADPLSVPDLTDAQIALRMACSSTAVTLNTVEFRASGGNRGVRIQDVGVNGSVNPGTQGTCPPSTAAIYTLRTTATPPKRRKLDLRGLVQSDIRVQGPLVTTTVRLDNALNAWLASLGGIGWGIRTLTKVKLIPPNINPVVKVDGATNPGYSLITCLADHGYTNGQEVIIARVSKKDFPGLRGHWAAIVPGPTTKQFWVQYRVPQDQANVPATGYTRAANYDAVFPFPSSQCAKIFRVNSRDTKDVVFHSRGASRAPKNRHSP